MEKQPISAQQRAERSAAVMWENDNAGRWFGMVLEQVGPGTARVSMRVQPHHTNGHDTCHGGVTFALADAAFALACNSYNRVAVAQHNSITYLAPAYAGDVLTARAIERSTAGRSGLYDIRITRDDGSIIAEFRGGSRLIRGQHFDEEET